LRAERSKVKITAVKSVKTTFSLRLADGDLINRSRATKFYTLELDVGHVLGIKQKG